MGAIEHILVSIGIVALSGVLLSRIRTRAMLWEIFTNPLHAATFKEEIDSDGNKVLIILNDNRLKRKIILSK